MFLRNRRKQISLLKKDKREDSGNKKPVSFTLTPGR